MAKDGRLERNDPHKLHMLVGQRILAGSAGLPLDVKVATALARPDMLHSSDAICRDLASKVVGNTCHSEHLIKV